MATLSVIIPVYRTEQTLTHCLQTVLVQAVADMEVILVDDGSPDSSPELCDTLAKGDSRIRVIHQANGGLSAARNAGLDVAQGEYVTFVDSDDWLQADTYNAVLPLLQQADIVEFPVWRDHTPLWTCPTRTFDDMRHYWLQGGYMHTYACNKVFRRSLFSGVRFPVGKVFEDAWTLPLLLARCKQLATCSSGGYYYSLNPQGITAQANGSQLQQLLEAHLAAMAMPHLGCDDRYYMCVLNIQLDVCRLTGQPPQLPRRSVSPLAAGLTMKQRIKAICLNVMGINRLCNRK